MDLKTDLITRATDYCQIAGISKARLATLVANDGKFFNRIEAGGGFTADMYERFLTFFRDHPAANRSRPTPTKGEAA